MTAPDAPAFTTSIVAVARLTSVRLMRGRKLRLAVIATLLVLFAVVASRYLGDGVQPATATREGTEWGFFRLLIFLVPFLFNSGAIAEEVEARTFTLLAARPASRAAIVFGKLLAGAAFSLLVIVPGLLILHVACFATEPSAMFEEFGGTLRVIGAASLLTLFYSAVCAFWGALLPEAAGIVSALYLSVVEFCFAWTPGFFRWVSMNYLAQQVAGFPKRGFLLETIPDLSAPIAVGVLVGMTLLFTALGALVVGFSEYRFSNA